MHLSSDIINPSATDGDRNLVADAASNLIDVWGDLAPAEALTRALVAERNENREMALRWTQVFLLTVADR